MSSTSTTWTTDTNTKSGTVQIYESNVSVLRITGIEDGNAILDLFADQGDDNADKWRMWVNASDDDLHFSNYTSGAWGDILTLQDGGNVGIGTSAPDELLHIQGSGAVTAEIESTGGNAALRINANTGTGESGVSYLYFDSHTGANHGEGDMEAGDEILRLDASDDADIHSTQLKIITIHDAGGEIGKFVTASDGNINTAWTNVSDVRLKKDIQDTSMDGLAIMNSIKLRDFKWNEESGNHRNNKQVIGGLIADEVYEVYRQVTTGTPGAVKEDGSIDRMGVTESQFITVMMKAIQELSTKVEALENK